MSTVDTAQEIADILENAADANPKAPRKLQVLHYYSHLYYQECIKPTVDAEWAKKKTSLANSDNENTKFVHFQNQITQRFWENETQVFRDNLNTKLDEEHAARRRVFDEHAEVTKKQESAEAYHSYVFNEPVLLLCTCQLIAKEPAALQMRKRPSATFVTLWENNTA